MVLYFRQECLPAIARPPFIRRLRIRRRSFLLYMYNAPYSAFRDVKNLPDFFKRKLRVCVDVFLKHLVSL